MRGHKWFKGEAAKQNNCKNMKNAGVMQAKGEKSTG